MADANLPYFDLLVDERKDGGETAQLWERLVHWGYWPNPKDADGTVPNYTAAMERLNDLLFEAVKLEDNQKLVDVGCGFGGTIQSINAAHTGMDLTGLNIDGRQLAAAEAQTKAANGNKIGWVEADACKLPFEDNTFDRVLAVECIFHFTSREEFLAEAQRVLKPGGYLALSDFVGAMTFFAKTPIWVALRSRISKSWGQVGKVPPRGYKSMAKRAGLELVEDLNIRKETLPTYPFLIKFFKEKGSADAEKMLVSGTRWMYWLSKLGLMQYRVVSFRKPE